jgi:hypothetical protein
MLTSVIGHHGSTYKDKPRKTLAIASKRFDAKTRSFYFTTNGYYPVDKISIRLTPKNAILLATLSSSNKENGPWLTRYSGLIYNLEKNGKDVSPSEISLSSTNDKYWRLSANEARDGLANMAPSMEIGWLPHQLVFVAQGNPPFRLAYGNSQLTQKNDAGLGLLLSQQSGEEIPGKASIGPQLTFSGNNALLPPPPDNSMQWKSIILWSVLVLGLIVLLTMVIRLYKQMDSDTSTG